MQGGWRSVVPTGPENRCREDGGVLSQQAQGAGAGRVEWCPRGPESRCREGGGVLSQQALRVFFFFSFSFSNRPREQVLGGRRSVVPQALRAVLGGWRSVVPTSLENSAGRVEE